MEIRKFKKEKSGMYRVEFDSFHLSLHEDLILKYDLLLTRQVDVDFLDVLKEENKKYEVYEVALRLLKTKMRSKKEMKDLLEKKAFDPVLVDSAVFLLSEQGYLNDQIYAQSFVHDRIALSLDGPFKIRRGLEECEIRPEWIEESLSGFPEELEKERIKKLIEKAIKSNHKKGGMVLKKKIQYDLSNLGYSYSLIVEGLNSIKMEDRSLAEKEYRKWRDTLSKKYSGRELEYKLKQKMYQKGFSTDGFEDVE